ncbi:MAG: hypothetical protein AAFX39_04375 [Pseudomonadota bacterium]
MAGPLVCIMLIFALSFPGAGFLRRFLGLTPLPALAGAVIVLVPLLAGLSALVETRGAMPDQRTLLASLVVFGAGGLITLLVRGLSIRSQS